MTTSSGVVSACASLGEAELSGDDGIALVRIEAARRGADTVRLISLSGRDIRAEFYRCAPPIPGERPTAVPAPGARIAATAVSAVPTVASVAPSASPTPSPSAAPGPRPTPGDPGSLDSRRRAASDRQKRAQEEFEDLKALVRVTSNGTLVSACEKRGEGRAPLENGEDALRGEAVGQVANVVLIRRTDSDLRGEYFRCSSARLQAIPRESAAPPH